MSAVTPFAIVTRPSRAALLEKMQRPVFGVLLMYATISYKIASSPSHDALHVWCSRGTSPITPLTKIKMIVGLTSAPSRMSSPTISRRAEAERNKTWEDIEDSEMGYLGYQASEAYGLTWKVRCEALTLG